MFKKLLILLVLTTFLATSGVAAELSKTAPIVEHKLITGDEPLPDVAVYPLQPGLITDSPGIQLGTTFYDYQTNGSSGNRIAVCSDGSKYFCWMKLLGWPYPPAPRHVYHNWMNSAGVLNPNNFTGQVSRDAGAGYTNLAVIYGNRGAIAYHSQGGSTPTYSTVSIDYNPPGLGFFDHYDPPDEIFPQNPPNMPGRCIWPYIAVDTSDNIHVTMSERSDPGAPAGTPQRLIYTNSTNGGVSWSNPLLVDTVMVIAGVIDASPVSNRVALAYSKTQDTSTQWNNDIVYVVSENGTTWDFTNGRINITNYGTDTDSLWAYTDLDVIIDYNDYINIVWNAQWVTPDGIYYRTDLYHYSEQTGVITEITHHPDSLWTSISGAWNRPICKMNMGVNPAGGLFVTWTQFDTSDVSAGGFGNGEIYMSYTADNGGSWSAPVNLTNSHSPGCYPGQCDSDHWSTLADEVDDSLHIIYINDKDAGGIVQTEGSATENPVKYMTYPAPMTGIDDDVNRPVSFSLNQNYPNPFNASTVISFSLKETLPVVVEVFDITGSKVATLADEVMTAGTHEVVWDASGVASGVYFYRMSAGDQLETRQAVLIK